MTVYGKRLIKECLAQLFGHMYEKKGGLIKEDQAVEWFQKAANQGCPPAQNKLGDA